MCWIAFDVDNPSRSFVCEETEAEVDDVLAYLDPDSLAKKEFPNVSVDDASAIADLVMM